MLNAYADVPVPDTAATVVETVEKIIDGEQVEEEETKDERTTIEVERDNAMVARIKQFMENKKLRKNIRDSKKKNGELT